MSKPDRETQLRRGEQLLREWGLPTSASEISVDALRTHSGRDPAADLAIAAYLGALPEAASVEALQALEGASTDKRVRKEVRRALYRLEQRGMAIPRREPPAPVRIATATTLEGYLSAIDGRGDQLVWLLKPQPGGLAHLFAVINDPEGLKEVNRFETTRKALRASRQELLHKHELRMIEADWRYCDYLIDRAFRWATERGETPSGDYPGLRAQLTKEAVSEMPPPILAHLDAETVRATPPLLQESHRLLEEREFRTWTFDQNALQPYIDEIQRIKDSPLVLNRLQQQERFHAIVERAIEELFGGARRTSWMRRLQEMAFFLHATARPEPAKWALAVALALETSVHGGRDIPFCEALARGSMAVFLQVEEEREEEQSRSSLVLTPQQAVREAQRRRS